ncbi:uncharacterized protein LOC101731018 isoform X1 [Xenopus tropicalis]|uniref:Uncharacterized protein LOC101731018 isoform X1 n=1 Tax=Xenopus tropicalis TaxID=8364 RepID=A0A8J0T2Z3_XENTR|nr:uncharacterized protein LOC101731018 isoform X1 [Xenopus tropicalis]
MASQLLVSSLSISLIFIGFVRRFLCNVQYSAAAHLIRVTCSLQERPINDDDEKFYYGTEPVAHAVPGPVCPVPIERNKEEFQCGNTQFVQEKPEPLPLLIPGDITCDGLLCPILPTAGQNPNPQPDLSGAIMQDFLPILPYIKRLFRDTEQQPSMEEILMDFLSPQTLILILLELSCLYIWDKMKAQEAGDGACAGTESEGEQSAAIKPHNHEEDEEEEALQMRESTKRKPRTAKVFFSRKKQICFSNEHQGSKPKGKRLGFNVRRCLCRSPRETERKRRTRGEEKREFQQLSLQFLSLCLGGDC